MLAKALGELGDVSAVEALIACLNDESQTMHRIAAESLGKIKDSRAIEPLLSAVEDKDPHVRKSCVLALSEFGSTAIEQLALEKNQYFFEFSAILAKQLVKIRDAKADELFILLARQKEGGSSLTPLVNFLERKSGLTYDELVPALIQYYKDTRDEFVICALSRTDKKAIEMFMKGYDKWIVSDHLLELGDSRGLAIILEERFAALTELGNLFNERKYKLNKISKLYPHLAQLVDLALVASSYTKKREYRYHAGTLELDTQLRATEKLCLIKCAASNNILQLIKNKRDISVTMTTSCEFAREWSEKLSFKEQRMIARNELLARGNPSYNPEAYLNFPLGFRYNFRLPSIT